MRAGALAARAALGRSRSTDGRRSRMGHVPDRAPRERRGLRRASGVGALGITTVALVMGLAACGEQRGGGASGEGPAASLAEVEELAPPTEAVALEFWNPFTGPDGAFMQTLVDQFNEETETVKVTVTTQPEYYTKVRAAAQSDTLPQVMIMHVDQIPLQAEDGIISPINDLVELQGLEASDFTEAIWTSSEWKGDRYGIPLDIHTMTMYWNKDLFEEAGLDPESPPTDEESFLEATRAITESTDAPGYMVVTSGPGAGFLTGISWATLFYQGGGEWTNEDFSEATYNSEAGVQAAEFLKSLIDEGISPASTESDAEIAAFKQGQNGIVFSGIWETTGYADALGDSLGAGPVPQIFGDGVWAGSHTLAVADGLEGAERQAAYYFIDWISQHSVEWAKAGQLPARASVREEPEFQEIPYISEIAGQIESASFFPPVPAAPDMLFAAGGAGEAVLAVLSGEKEAQAALDESAQRSTQILQENKEKYGY